MSGIKNNIKGVILAGGTGTRLLPLTRGVNKHLLPIGNKPMILYPLIKLQEAGVKEVLIITGPEHLSQFAQLLGEGSEWGCQVHFRVQGKPGGIAEALSLVEPFVNQDPFWVLLGDNLFGGSLLDANDQFPLQEEEALVMLKEVKDPERFGIAVMKGNRVVDVVEKPKAPMGNLCVTGIYAYRHSVFDVIREVKPSQRGEMEISDVNRFYARAGRLKHHLLREWWIDAGTLDAFREANQLLENKSCLK